jgi:hypothetical protein
VWLIWCIGNSPEYRRGSFRQYVHMIEMAAAGSLLADLRCLASQPPAVALQLHVIKPSRPIPLDPSYFLGRIDGTALIGMGYRDACAYLRAPKPFTLPCGNEVTAMDRVEPAVSTTAELEGTFSWGEGSGSSGEGSGSWGEGSGFSRERSGADRPGPFRMSLHLQGPQDWWPDGVTFDAVGDITIPGWPARHPVERGSACFDPSGGMELDLGMWVSNTRYHLQGQSAGGRLFLTLRSADQPAQPVVGSGTLSFDRAEAMRLIRALHTSDYPSLLRGWQAKSSVARAMWQAMGTPA